MKLFRQILVVIALFALGAVVGSLIAYTVIRCFAKPFGDSIYAAGLVDLFSLKIKFSMLCGALFAAAPLSVFWISRVSRPALWIGAYLLAGCATAALVAGVTYLNWQSLAETTNLGLPFRPMISFSSLPILRIPCVGTLGVLGLGALHRAYLKRTAN